MMKGEEPRAEPQPPGQERRVQRPRLSPGGPGQAGETVGQAGSTASDTCGFFFHLTDVSIRNSKK